MPISMDGLNPQSREAIKKLTEVEVKKLKVFADQMTSLNNQNRDLAKLRALALDLQKSLESLYNFDSPFEKRVVQTSPDGYVEGVANKDAALGKHSIDVKNIASALSIASKAVPNDKKLPESDITIGDKTAHFSGGDLNDFKNFLNRNFSKILSAKVIRKNAEESIFVIDGKTQGNKGILDLKDTAGLLKDMELTGNGTLPNDNNQGNSNNQTASGGSGGQKEDYTAVPFTLDHLSVVKEGPISFADGNKSMMLGQDAARKLDLPKENKPGRKIKAISFEIVKRDKSQTVNPGSNTPDNITVGPQNQLNIQGIILNSYNLTRLREDQSNQQQQPPDENYDFGITMPNGTQSLKNSGTLISIPVSSVPDYIEFYTHNKEVTFKNLQLVYSVEQQNPDQANQGQGTDQNKKNGAVDKNIAKQKAMFPHLIRPAQNAHLNLDGIDIERETNKELKDVIDGATLTLKKPTENPIDLMIESNLDKSKEMVDDFITKYNTLLDYSRNVSSGVKRDSEGKLQAISEEERKASTLITSSLVRNLIYGMQIKISNSYPADRDPFIKILQMIGIGTGKPNSDWAKISELHLKFEDEDLFRQMVTKYPAAVRDFFGIDRNGDVIIDDGLGFRLVEFLKGYTSTDKASVIESQINSNKDNIKRLAETKKKREAKIEDYVQTLKRKFGHMQGVIEQSNATRNSLQQGLRNTP